MKISRQSLKPVFRSKLLWAGLAWVALFPTVYEALPTRIELTMDHSLEHSIWLTHKPFDPANDQYGVFAPTVKNEYTRDVKYLFKEIGCRGGQELQTSITGEYFCESKYLGSAKPTDKNGKPVEHFVFNGIVPQGSFFMVGTHERSYDSRYYGFVRADQIERGARPLW